MPDRLSAGAVLLAPAIVLLYLAFSAGGFFAGSTAVAALILLGALALRILTGAHPVAGANLWVLVASVSLAGFGAWILLSQIWSDSAARALLEFDRVLVYLAVLLLVGLRRRSRGRMQALVWAIGIAIVVIVGAGLLTRILPEVFPTDPAEQGADRLSHPLTYWNGLGITAALGIVLALAVASDRRQPRVARPLAAASIVPLGAALLFTFSRGSIAAAALGLAVFALVARPRELLTTLIAVAPPLAVALIVCYQADVVASEDFASAEGVDQGRTVALVVLAAMAVAGSVQALLLSLDDRLAALRLPEGTRRPALIGTTALVFVALVISVAALDAPGAIGRQVDRFLEGGDVKSDGDVRARLTDVSNNRADHWDVAVDAWQEGPLVGKGAGTFVLLWAEDRPIDFTVIDAHSLYVETLAELGVVGLLLLLVAVGALLVGTARRCRSPDRVLYAGVLAVIVTWAVHAGIDWDWELPSVTMVPFALGGAALASSKARVPDPRQLVRVVIGIGLLIAALTPFSIAISQSRLDASVDAIREGDCARTTDKALDSIDALSARPEPFELLAYCNARAGRSELAEQMAREAIERDPRNWEYQYDLALVRAVAGEDPRAAIRRAGELNPLEGRVPDLERKLRTDDPEQWRAAGRTAPLLLP